MNKKSLIVSVCLVLFCSSIVVFADTAREGIKSLAWINKKEDAPDYMKHQTFYSEANKADVGFYIYLPPGYEKNKDVRYPVIYSLHGGGGDEARNFPVTEILNKAVTEKKILPVIMVLPNGIKGSSYFDSYDGTLMIETMIIKELIPHIDKKYRTIADKRGRGLQGFSMGGAGTLTLGMKYPTLFSSLCPFSGKGFFDIDKVPKDESGALNFENEKGLIARKSKILGTDINYWKESASGDVIEKNIKDIRGKIGVHITFGEKEKHEEQTAYIRSIFDKNKIKYEMVIHPYGHRWGDPEHVISSLDFHFKHYKLTDAELSALKGSM